MYSGEAEAYARTWAPVLLPMSRELLRSLPLDGVRRGLDVGTGTGALHDDLRAAMPGALVIGVDRSEGMLAARTSRDVPVAVMDAVGLALAAGSVDAAVATFVLHHMLDPVAALAEVRRVLTPGGFLGAATWGEDEECPALELWTDALDAAGAPPDEEISIANHDLMDTEEKLAGLLRAAGFCEARTWTRRLVHPWTREAFLDYVLHAGRRRRRLDGLPPDDRRAFLEETGRRLGALSEKAFAYRADVVFAVARA
jgi:ubiquinone/menaquinone biosynthesis C-methylase UbiE